MPTFFFHLCGPDSVERDDDGVEFPDVEAAYLEAFQTASEMWIEAIRKRRDPSHLRFEIADRSGQLLLEVPFAEAIGRRIAPRQQRSHTEPPQDQTVRREAPSRRRSPRRLQSDFRTLMEQAERTRDLGNRVIEQIRTARQQLEKSRGLLQQLRPLK